MGIWKFRDCIQIRFVIQQNDGTDQNEPTSRVSENQPLYCEALDHNIVQSECLYLEQETLHWDAAFSFCELHFYPRLKKRPEVKIIAIMVELTCGIDVTEELSFTNCF